MRTLAHIRAGRNALGFTLVELLTVVMIIMLLVGILLPSLAGARIAVMRERCKHNCKELAKACVAYATESANHRGVSNSGLACTANALPNTMANQGDWGKFTCVSPAMPAGNIGAYWMLYKMNYIGPENLFCLESEQQRETRQLNENDLAGFHGTSPNKTICYSYLCQYYNTTEGGTTASTLKSGVSIVDTPAYVVIAADWNPGVSDADTGAAQASTDNSLNHKKEGQNFARLDGSAEWSEVRALFVKISNGTTVTDDLYVNRGSTSAAGPRQEYTVSVLLPATDDFLLQ